MATNANWTIVMDDKKITKNYAEGASEGIGFLILDDDAFWNQSKFSNIWAIQYGASNTSDEVEYRDETPHSTWESTGLDFQPFIDKWDAAHLVYLQNEWDNTPGHVDTGVLYADEAEKIADLGARPTSYSS